MRFVESQIPEDEAWLKAIKRGFKTFSLFDTVRLRNSLTSLLAHELPYKGLPFKELTFVNGENEVKFAVENKEFILNLDTYTIAHAPPLSEAEKKRFVPQFVREGQFLGLPAVMEVLSPDRLWFAGIRDHNLWLRSTYDGRREPLTADGIKGYEWDVEGANWSPDSFKLAVKKVDKREVHPMPLVHWLKPSEEIEWVYFTRAGTPLHQTELFIVDVLSKQQVKVDIGGESDQYIYIIGWRPDGSELLFFRMNREYKKLDLMAANPTTGSTRVVLTETQKSFIIGLPFLVTWPYVCTLLNDGKTFIWISERDGWNHLYLHDINGNLIRRLTEGAFPVVRVITLDEKTGWVYFNAHGDKKRPYDTHLYRVNLDGKGFKCLTEKNGQHYIQISPSKEFFLDIHQTVSRPLTTELRSVNGKLIMILSKANIDALKKNLTWSPPEEFMVKAADKKTNLYGVLYKPYDFNPNKKYPVIDYIYNGPQSSWVPRSFSSSNGTLSYALSQLGFVVFMIDGRGTPERGKEFQDVVYENFGRNEIPDHVATLKQLAANRPYMDLNRVGIFGGSWGGYMTIRAMVLAPDVYHVGIATAPYADLYDHPAMAIEPYMGLPQNNKEGYDYGSSLRLAGKLKGKLLLIHGTSDINAPFSATMKMVEALIRAGKPFDLVVMPDQDHHPSGMSRRYWMDAVRRYFQEHLCPDD